MWHLEGSRLWPSFECEKHQILGAEVQDETAQMVLQVPRFRLCLGELIWLNSLQYYQHSRILNFESRVVGNTYRHFLVTNTQEF